MDPLADSVLLGVVRAGVTQTVSEHFAQVFPETAGELCTLVGEDGLEDAEY